MSPKHKFIVLIAGWITLIILFVFVFIESNKANAESMTWYERTQIELLREQNRQLTRIADALENRK